VDRTFVTLTSFWTVLQVNLFSLEELLNAKNNLAFCVSEREREGINLCVGNERN